MSKQVSRRVFGPKDPNTAGKRALETPVDPPGKRGVARREPHIDNMYIDSSSEDGEDSIEENPIADAIQSRASAGKQKNTSQNFGVLPGQLQQQHPASNSRQAGKSGQVQPRGSTITEPAMKSFKPPPASASRSTSSNTTAQPGGNPVKSLSTDTAQQATRKKHANDATHSETTGKNALPLPTLGNIAGIPTNGSITPAFNILSIKLDVIIAWQQRSALLKQEGNRIELAKLPPGVSAPATPLTLSEFEPTEAMLALERLNLAASHKDSAVPTSVQPTSPKPPARAPAAKAKTSFKEPVGLSSRPVLSAFSTARPSTHLPEAPADTVNPTVESTAMDIGSDDPALPTSGPNLLASPRLNGTPADPNAGIYPQFPTQSFASTYPTPTAPGSGLAAPSQAPISAQVNYPPVNPYQSNGQTTTNPNMGVPHQVQVPFSAQYFTPHANTSAATNSNSGMSGQFAGQFDHFANNQPGQPFPPVNYPPFWQNQNTANNNNNQFHQYAPYNWGQATVPPSPAPFSGSAHRYDFPATDK